MAATPHDLTLQASPAARRERLRSIIGGSAGNVIEWYDFLAYSIFSIYFSKAFFPGGNQTAQLLNAAAVAAIGYVVRPLGSWAIGALADRHGRRVALSLSVAMMSVGSLIIALTPTYATIGVAAPAVLVCARLLQGFSMGGEAGTSATYLSEMAPTGRRGFFVGFVQVTVVMGQLVALALMLMLQRFALTPTQLEEWGWRIPFAIGGALAVFALYLRRGIAETDAFERADTLAAGQASRESERGSLLALLVRHRMQTLWTIGISIGGTVAFYTFTIYLQKYMVNTTGFSRDTATLITTVALVIYMCFQPLYGLLSDVVGRRPVMLIFGIGGTFCTVPLMHALGSTHSVWAAFALNLAALAILSGFSSIHWLVKSELFPAKLRALGVGLPFAVVSSVMGGTTEYLALKFKHAGHESWFFYYVSACAAVSLVTYWLMPETRHRSVIDEEARGQG
ncbi:MFS transporter, MHS family, alpha-ketoglutarate permease [Paraburkholderia steynii]|uniref:MFS transporter, MHS family, alpha-ketoglutarate permease n=1 Tax=Paraburkholderia steynii TaxID=1245441 RepID=A0A7Z7FHH6_9BURK|nr:MFS transporter [Paraburkholderia steynii]SDH35402.1 MFS transporter, MHS family, alpha-ketoglutarate permease [Paraburkholderia steynii]